ncbi:hypothetical protein [Pseudomonas carassii]|uniref:Uncharacterized protein n=1 Tax=Pseudomonas carassii TaxID=3115855 RepID=A0ABU7H5E5_9PSED|nr:hypothetical protein [Pseudomonas sp. 137P]MEE1886473.1 hypothetical protein [Pseudomonas sp. 137P]
MPDLEKLAVTASYDARTDLITVLLLTGAELSFKPGVTEELVGLSQAGLATIQVSQDGEFIEFLDGRVDVYLPVVIEGARAGLSSVRGRLIATTAQMDLLIGNDRKHPLWHCLQELKSCLGYDY